MIQIFCEILLIIFVLKIEGLTNYLVLYYNLLIYRQGLLKIKLKTKIMKFENKSITIFWLFYYPN